MDRFVNYFISGIYFLSFFRIYIYIYIYIYVYFFGISFGHSSPLQAINYSVIF